MKLKRFATQQQFAKALEVSPPTMSRLLGRDDFPAAKNPPWTLADVAKVQKWRADVLREDRAALEHARIDPAMKPLRKKKLEQEVRKLSAQADAAELELSRQRGALLDAAQVQVENVGKIIAVKAAMKLAVQKLADALFDAAHDRQEYEVIIEAEFRRICNEFAGVDAAG